MPLCSALLTLQTDAGLLTGKFGGHAQRQIGWVLRDIGSMEVFNILPSGGLIWSIQQIGFSRGWPDL